MLVTSTLPVTGGNIGAARTYLNGTVTNAGTGSTAITTTNLAIYHLGISANLNIQYLDGRVDDVAIWDEALSADQIRCLHDVGSSSGLFYTAGAFDQLKQVHDSGAGSVTFSGIQWTYATGLTGPAGLTTTPGGHTLVFNAAADTGLTAPPTFDTWINGFDWSGITNPDLTLSGDPDGDGIDNGVENYFGTDPGNFSPGLVAGERNGSQFTFTHPVSANPASGLTHHYRWSTDLVNFHDDGAPDGAGTTTVTFSNPVPAGEVVAVTASFTGSVIPGRIFVRVEVTQN
jgi:hypothetical protein